jgi:hypothetical protein
VPAHYSGTDPQNAAKEISLAGYEKQPLDLAQIHACQGLSAKDRRE